MDIDFVVTWVDNEDPEWQAAFRRWLPANSTGLDTGEERYRNWHLLRYWFRGVEQFAPWVRKVHFVTNGQLPSWLNTQHPRLHIVKHSDIMPADALPTFNSNAIEMNLHKTEGLSEHFVYFNDDVFLVGKVGKDHFFRGGLPRDIAVTRWRNRQQGMMRHIVENNLRIVNSRFNKYGVIFRRPHKWFRLAYGSHQLRDNLLALGKPRFEAFLDPHSALPLTKHTIEELWSECPDALSATTHHRFRSPDDVSPWLFRYWRLCKGEFSPTWRLGENRYFYRLDLEQQELMTAINGHDVKTVAINDSADYPNAEALSASTAHAFHSLLPTPCSFESKEQTTRSRR